MWVRALSWVSMIVLFYERDLLFGEMWASLILERHFGCCSLLPLSPSFLYMSLFSKRIYDLGALSLSLPPSITVFVSYFKGTLWLMRPVTVSLSFCYLSLISERPFGCCSWRALSLSPSSSISVSYFRETLWLLLLTGPVSVSISSCYLSLVSERPYVCCSSLPLSPSFHYLSLISKRLSVTYEPCLCLYLLLLSVSCFRETRRLLLLVASVSLLPLYISYFKENSTFEPCLCLSRSIICLLFQRDLVAAAPLWGKEETDRKQSQ